jgi:hypothetical protein
MILVVSGIFFLWCSGLQNTRLVRLRAAYHLDSAAPLENAPPLLAFTTVAAGGFSSLAADLLWLRVSQLQDDGRYFELVQLANWITKLEPRCGEIWTFHAWNMAYNISVMMPDPEDRWRWVKNGLELLRDEGLRYNAGDPKVYWEIAWLFLHKIGGTLDQAHLYYKSKWAEEMTSVLGAPQPDYEALTADAPKVRRLEEEYKLIPKIMRQVDGEYGPLDWRLAQTHAVYWALRSRQHAGPERELPCDRLILQSLTALFVHGRLASTASENVFLAMPAVELFPKIVKAYEAAIEKYKEDVISLSYANFLTTAVKTFYSLDRKAEAKAVFDRLAARFPSKETEKGFESFVPHRE